MPLWIAGRRREEDAPLAAKYAQYTNFDVTPEVFRRKSEILAGHCADVGTDYDAIVRSASTRWSSARPRPTWPTGWPGSRAT